MQDEIAAPGQSVFPEYTGRGLANLGATLCRLFGAPDEGLLSPLDPEALPPALLDGVELVVLVLVDGLGMGQLQRAIAAGDAPTLARLIDQACQGEGSLATLTSVFPSATMSALASVNTGVAPAQHGILGWTLYLPEFGQVAEMARWGPVDVPGASYQDPQYGGHDPVAFLGVSTVYQRLAAAGVASFIVNPREYRGSALSRMLFNGAQEVDYSSGPGLAVNLERLLALGQPGARSYIYVYYSGVDAAAHLFGPRSAEHAAEIATVDFWLGRVLARRRPTGRTLFLLTADHGHVFTPPANTLFTDTCPGLKWRLAALPSGERRLLYLHARDGAVELVREAAQQCWGQAACLVPTSQALAAGLFGPGEPSEAARRRMGDLLVVARGDWQFTLAPKPDRPAKLFFGNHGALDPEEMLVPLLAWRC